MERDDNMEEEEVGDEEEEVVEVEVEEGRSWSRQRRRKRWQRRKRRQRRRRKWIGAILVADSAFAVKEEALFQKSLSLFLSMLAQLWS